MPAYSSSQRVDALFTTQQETEETTNIDCIADTGAQEVTTITFAATAGTTQADYFTFENQAGDDFAVNIDIDANTDLPTGAAFVAATTKIETDIVAGDTAAQVAAKVVTAIGAAFTDVTIVDNSDGTVTFTQDLVGTTVDAVPHDDDDAGAGSIGVSVGTAGAASNLQNKFLLLRIAAGTVFHIWGDINSEGVDPNPGGSTAIAASIATGDTANAVATAYAAAIDGNGNFSAAASGSVVRLTNAATGAAIDATDTDTTFTVTVLHQGMAQKYTPDASPEDLSVEPSLIGLPT